ncbi:MAG: radical SAM protein [Acidobacteriota bacterium]
MMASWLRRPAQLARLALRPVSAEKRQLLEERWQELPDGLRTDNQVVGRQLAHCGYTMGAAYCSFSCTHCYLPRNANRTPLPTLAEMKEQIDANRRLLGENGALQITGGDVLDAYWKADRIDELVEILRYAAEASTVPMLMTHGQVLLDQPHVFERLVGEGGLRKLAIHIDITQAGRPEYPLKRLRRESDLHPLRQRFVEAIEAVREKTGCAVSAAHTVTVTEANADSIADILEWLLEDGRRLRAFRMISLQTEADVGRTRMSDEAVHADDVWQTVAETAGLDLLKDAFLFGHSDCSRQALVARLGRGGPLVDLLPEGEPTRRVVARTLGIFGGVGTRGNDGLAANVQRLSLLARSPSFLLDVVRHIEHVRRSAGLSRRRFLPGALRALRETTILNIVQHNFMDSATVQSGCASVNERLQACSFRGAVQRNGVWEAVPMCEVNAGPREQLYSLAIESRTRAEAN